jgi:hypothetical protein
MMQSRGERPRKSFIVISLDWRNVSATREQSRSFTSATFGIRPCKLRESAGLYVNLIECQKTSVSQVVGWPRTNAHQEVYKLNRHCDTDMGSLCVRPASLDCPSAPLPPSLLALDQVTGRMEKCELSAVKCHLQMKMRSLSLVRGQFTLIRPVSRSICLRLRAVSHCADSGGAQ